MLKTTIHVYTHHLVVRDPSPRIKDALYALANKYTQFSMEWDRVLRRQVWRPVKTFGVYVSPGDEFRFHIGQLEPLFKEFTGFRVHPSGYDVIYHPEPKCDEVELPVKEGWVLRKEQLAAKEFITNNTEPGHNHPILMIRTGGGKDQPLDALIKIPGGWSTMGDMKEGMTITAWDGTPTQVTGVFPQGMKRILRVEFEDGRSTECGETHLWQVYTGETTLRYECLEAHQLATRLKERGMYIDLPVSEIGEDITLYKDPFTYGKNLSTGLAKPIYAELKTYFNASHRQRCEFTNGLLRGGALTYLDGVIQYHVKALQLAKVLQYMVRTLGGKSFIEEEEGGFVTRIHLPNPAEVLPFPVTGTFKPRLKVKQVVFAGNSETQCISIDHPDRLYITDQFIVTHNTVTALITASELGKRLAIVVLAMYIDKWVGDLTNIYDIDKNDIGIIKGSDLLQRTTLYPSSGKELPKVFVISIPTLNAWYRMYETDPTNPALDAYECKPYELFEHLGVGTVIFDEVHQHPHPVFKVYTYLNVLKTINLSATLLTEEQTLRKVQSMMFPYSMRFDKVEVPKYIECQACSYQIHGFHHSGIRFLMQGRQSYSHVEFEKSILKHKKLGPQYLAMIMELFDEAYFDDYLRGDKALIFVATIKMARVLEDLMRKKYKGYKIKTYVEGEPLENATESDICISTIISAGTAIDIPKLRVSIMTISINSPVSNVQALGRLRYLNDRDTRFYYLYCSNVPKQVEYHRNKIELFKDRVRSHSVRLFQTLYA